MRNTNQFSREKKIISIIADFSCSVPTGYCINVYFGHLISTPTNAHT